MSRYGSPSKDQVVVLKSEDGVHHELMHPHTGQIVYVKRIEFEDGTFFPPEPKRATRLIKIKASTTR